MNPQKLRSRMKKKGVAGTFMLKGPVFNDGGRRGQRGAALGEAEAAP